MDVVLIFTRSSLQLTPGDPHVGSHLEAWMNVDDCSPDHITSKMSRDKLHGGCQVISGLVALLCVVICMVGSRKTRMRSRKYVQT